MDLEMEREKNEQLVKQLQELKRLHSEELEMHRATNEQLVKQRKDLDKMVCWVLFNLLFEMLAQYAHPQSASRWNLWIALLAMAEFALARILGKELRPMPSMLEVFFANKGIVQSLRMPVYELDMLLCFAVLVALYRH